MSSTSITGFGFGSPVPYSEPAWYNTLSSPHYTASHRRLRSFLREYVDTNYTPDLCAAWEECGTVPLDVRRRHVQQGFLIPGIPAKYTGDRKLPGDVAREEWDGFHSLILVDETARIGVLGVIWALGGGTSIGLPPLLNYGTDEQINKFLPRVLDGQDTFCLGITEPDAGSDVSGIQTTAERSSDGTSYIVNGTKKWITNGMWADYCTCAVRTGGDGASGISMLIVPLNAPGVKRIPIKNSGVNCSGSAYLHFEDVVVPRQNLLGKANAGFPIIMSNFNNERLSLSISSIRLARICIQDAWMHALTRETFGKKLMENQIIRAKFADMGRLLESTWALIESLVYHRNSCLPSDQGRDLAGLLALAKVQGSTTLELVNRECQQIMGGLGYQRGTGKGSRIEQISRDLRVQCVGGGSHEIMQDLAIKSAIGAFLHKTSSQSKL